MLGGHYLIGCALLLVCGASAAPRLQLDYESPLSLQAIDAPPSDPESYGLMYPRLVPQYRPSLNWAVMPDPRLYMLNELANMQDLDYPMKSKRRQPSLSIGNPIDVLREKLALDFARKQLKENKIQAEKNRAFLKNVGKRDAGRTLTDLYDMNSQDPKQPEDNMAADNMATNL
ncbi:corticotropin-releasing diuretic hormone 44 [Arctopsyche grandis]|uniref:corticotropin-releasing diuretic hormone 44 n=1 Tax=Arctopsyche grandis TaxID=121162 RepID=UPI00406D9761